MKLIRAPPPLTLFQIQYFCSVHPLPFIFIFFSLFVLFFVCPIFTDLLADLDSALDQFIVTYFSHSPLSPKCWLIKIPYVFFCIAYAYTIFVLDNFDSRQIVFSLSPLPLFQITFYLIADHNYLSLLSLFLCNSP